MKKYNFQVTWSVADSDESVPSLQTYF